QLLDDAAYDGRADSNQKAGADYGMYAPNGNKVLKPIGEWNHSKLIFNHGHVEHWLNGKKIVEFYQQSEDWKGRKESGKWKTFPYYGNAKSGKICLQDHGHKAYFKNIFIKEL
ncbi:MAG: 3-keto-disaccharide hydrolase, partial [Ginsengibacter sp.]